VSTVLDFIAIIAVLAGTLFSVVGVLGYIRLPDVYTRLHATGKVGVFGVVLLLVAAVADAQVGIGRALLLMALLLVIGPATTHAIASAAYRLGIEPRPATRDDLKQES
jgi:multicomponent Na+:H+ antiporter subunit G